MKGYFATFLKSFVFSGRASRKEFWVFNLINTILFIIVYLLSQILIIPAYIDYKNSVLDVISVISSFLAIVCLIGTIIFPIIVFIPSLAVMIRRLHDTNREGWLVLLGLIPFIGGIILLVYLIEDSNPGGNKYGLNAKLN